MLHYLQQIALTGLQGFVPLLPTDSGSWLSWGLFVDLGTRMQKFLEADVSGGELSYLLTAGVLHVGNAIGKPVPLGACRVALQGFPLFPADSTLQIVRMIFASIAGLLAVVEKEVPFTSSYSSWIGFYSCLLYTSDAADE